MIKKSTIFDFLMQVMIIWGIAILSLCLVCLMFGELAQDYSTIFQMGRYSISIATLLQFLGFSVVIAGERWLFFTDKLIKGLSLGIRLVLMFVTVIISTGVFAGVFRWFPVNQTKPWVMFLVCFTVCTAVSVGVMMIKEKSDNRKMQDALERLKGEGFDE